jgi:hypothetical protein
LEIFFENLKNQKIIINKNDEFIFIIFFNDFNNEIFNIYENILNYLNNDLNFFNINFIIIYKFHSFIDFLNNVENNNIDNNNNIENNNNNNKNNENIENIEKNYEKNNNENYEKNIKKILKNQKNILINKIKINEINKNNNFQEEISLKIILNLISTITFLKNGFIYKNRMINLNITNKKLFDRGVHIISNILNLNYFDSKLLLFKSIFKNFNVQFDDSNNSYFYYSDYKIIKFLPSDYDLFINTAKDLKFVLPVAILIYFDKFSTFDDLFFHLENEPVIRNLISNYLKNN